ncbi:MAG: thiamine-phosphate kinase [Candidatus Hadarchaeum sp.]|uniref:thiamine-phosphate kinase n=1 Tax=Candidatus Hadarchaeum sp. TaxID=2883567 RepID=UPI003D0A6E13
MKLNEVGEKVLIETAKKTFRKGKPVRIGIGDDAAAIDLPGEKCLVVTTDMLVASSHFPPRIKPEQIGRKSVVVNLSDLASMGAEPLGLIFSVAMPRDLEFEFAARIMKGMEKTVEEYRTYVVGGDLDEADEITIAGAAFGLAKKNRILLRSGARKGDILAVTGELGAAAAGLKILMEKIPHRGYEKLVKAQLEPNARVKEGMILAASGHVKAATDVSDGLAANLWHLSRESGVKIVIDREKIPVHSLVKKFSRQYGYDVDDFALYSGEDFELIFTTPPRFWESVKLALHRVGTRATVIGKVVDGKGVFIKIGESTEELEDRGYEHFK